MVHGVLRKGAAFAEPYSGSANLRGLPAQAPFLEGFRGLWVYGFRVKNETVAGQPRASLF